MPVPEVLLQSEGATSSSICKVRDTACHSPVAHRGGGTISLTSPDLTWLELNLAVIGSSSGCSLRQRDAPSPFWAQVVGSRELAHVLFNMWTV